MAEDIVKPLLFRAAEAAAVLLLALYAADKVQTVEIEYIKAEIRMLQRRGEISDERQELIRREVLSKLDQIEKRLFDLVVDQPHKRRKGD